MGIVLRKVSGLRFGFEIGKHLQFRHLAAAMHAWQVRQRALQKRLLGLR